MASDWILLKAFLGHVAKQRSRETTGSGEPYERRATHLRFGKGGRGQLPTGMRLANATVLREFYLSGGIGRSAMSGRYCDVVVADLDSSDGLFLVVENKLFTRNHRGQLAHYLHTVESRYSRAAIREYVYLTIDGSEPDLTADEDAKHHHRWVRVSWVRDIRELLHGVVQGRDVDPAVHELLGLLEWLGGLVRLAQSAARPEVDTLAGRVVLATAECLHEELVRIDGGSGSWGEPPSDDDLASGGGLVRLRYTRTHAHHLRVQLLPSYSVALQTRHKSGKAQYEKILVPFGAHPDQVFNLLDIAARDIYHAKFADPIQVLADRRRLRVTRSQVKAKHLDLFRFLYRRRFELRVLLGVSSVVRQAEEDGADAEGSPGSLP